jgi:manganese transport protein
MPTENKGCDGMPSEPQKTATDIGSGDASLSFGIPFALVPLVLFTLRREVMGELVNHWLTTVLASIVAGLIIALNIFLLYQLFLGG